MLTPTGLGRIAKQLAATSDRVDAARIKKRLTHGFYGRAKESRLGADVEVVEAVIVGNRLKQLLKARKLSQEETSRRVGVSYRHFNRVVLGVSDPSLLLALRLSAVLGEPIDRIFQVRLVTRRRAMPAGSRA